MLTSLYLPARWRIGDFSPCSTTCGGGLMIREVTCIQEVSSVVDKVLTLPDFMCQKPVPQRVRTCNTQFCPADWATGFWSEVSRWGRDGLTHAHCASLDSRCLAKEL